MKRATFDFIPLPSPLFMLKLMTCFSCFSYVAMKIRSKLILNLNLT